jgi:hypothetical protein
MEERKTEYWILARKLGAGSPLGGPMNGKIILKLTLENYNGDMHWIHLPS